MQDVKFLVTAIAVLLALFLAVSAQHPDALAQDRVAPESEQDLESEDLPADTETVSPEDGTASDLDENEDEYPDSVKGEDEQVPENDAEAEAPSPLRDEEASHPSDPGTVSEEAPPVEPPVVTSGPPALPDANAQGPLDRVALHFVVKGVEATDAGDFVRARALFERAIEIAPMQPYSYFFLGKLALTRGEHQKAVPLLRKADVLLMRGDQAWRSEAVSTLGAVYEDLGEFPRARRAYRKSLQLFPQNLRAMSALARLAEEEPRPDDAVPH